MRLAILHRRLVALMGMAALGAYVAGAGASPATLLAGSALGLSLFWLPPPEWGAWIERVARAGAIALFGWTIYVSFVVGRDFMAPVLGILLFLLGIETLRSLDARNDVRLYSLAFALLIAGTAYYPGLGFAASFAAFTALATVGMMVGFLRRQTERFRSPEPRLGRRFLAATAALSLVVLVTSTVLFVLFPRLPRQWSVQGRRGAGVEMTGFSEEVSIGEFGGTIGANPEVMFRVEFPEGVPAGVESMYWRGRSFDLFDGTRWVRTRSPFVSDLSPRAYAERWGMPFHQARVFGGPPGAPVFFGPHPLLAVTPRSAVRTYRDPSGDALLFGTQNPVYTIVWTGGRPSDQQLRLATGDDGPARRPYVRLTRMDPSVRRLADSLTAGITSRIDQVRAIESYLQREYRYTLDLPRNRSEATLESFLFRRRAGHCEYFSTALAVLLRARGIPTRNVNGFLGGEWNANGGYLAVTGNHAHSWVEVWFPEWGWVPFDATPPGRAEAVDGAGSWWPALFWLDGVEYRWYKWVVDYNLERQFAVFRSVQEMFSRDPASRAVSGEEDSRRPPAAWVLAAAVVALGLWTLRGRRRAAVPPEVRAYLVLRRAYARAGFRVADDAGPLAFAEALARDGAPGAEDVGRAVDLYIRARFAGHPPDAAARRDLAAAVSRARVALRRSRKPASAA